jgi:hypothetical protein
MKCSARRISESPRNLIESSRVYRSGFTYYSMHEVHKMDADHSDTMSVHINDLRNNSTGFDLIRRRVYARSLLINFHLYRSNSSHRLYEVQIEFHKFFALMTEAASAYEKSVSFYQTTRRNIPDDGLHSPQHFLLNTSIYGLRSPGL